ncbi:3'(2'),5'-bisphosphate nucleotidase [Hasllibacter halocynthiae]|uniref:3'(2'),5'-bisphosphate nucleotidase CysQ n=1 Tax=Hasllibacter halocynthiae TaxID=595589 RepID=A0A2T0X288_9RHOB|nr:3'(2'),5'-bisphosphate nucleotidase CysQ [Hasllibacter halocynthiae]PRY93015.1 3'(2'),5'-bisphosphate nucleotidase [Hasllibacter halocynthiae]
MDMDRLVATMRRLALAGGEAIMEVYGSGDLGVEAKADDSPVTRADKAADAVISAGLREAFPDVALVTEEQAATHSKVADRFLIVDPLDGTKEFVRRRGDFTVNIALVEDGAPVRGVVYAPARRRLFYTDASGASVEEEGPFGRAPGRTTPLQAAHPGGPLRVVASKSHRDAATDAYIARYDVAGIVSAGSSLKFCLVAAGEADLYPRFGPTMEWDTAAGDAVLRGAGGRMIDLGTGGTFRYGKPGYRNGSFLAHGPGVAPR